MAMSTQILFLCLCCFVADSYFFTLEFYDGEDHYRIPVGLPDPFALYPGMFDPPTSYPKGHYHKRPFTSDVTTAKPDLEENAVTTTENVEKDIYVPKPEKTESEQDPSLKKSVKIDDKAPTVEVKRFPQVNTLSIHDEPILSVKIPDDREKRTTELPKVEAGTTMEEAVNDTENLKNDTNAGLTRNTDYILIPVNAVNPNEASITLSPMVGMDNGYNLNQGYPINGVNNMNPNYNSVNPNYNNMNPNFANAGSYSTQPMQYDNGINPQYTLPNQGNAGNPNLYTMVTTPNMRSNNMQAVPNNNNLYYLNNGNPNMVQPNSPQMYSLVPINNYPTNFGMNQPYNNQPNNYIPNYNQPTNGIYNNIPMNYVPIDQPNNFIPPNNNYVPINNQPNNFIPSNNNNFPTSQPNNFNPYYNQPINGQPNNFVPISNQPNNFGSYNNVPNNYVPYSGNFIPLKDKSNDTVVNDDGAGQPPPQPVALVALNEKKDADNATGKIINEQKDVENNESKD